MYYSGGTIAGPFYEYRDYINFVEKKDSYKSIPSTVVASILRFGIALGREFNSSNHYCLVFVALNVLLEDTFHSDYVYT